MPSPSLPLPTPLLPTFLLEDALACSPVPWDSRVVEEAEKLTLVVGNCFGRTGKDQAEHVASCLRRLARLGRAALQPFACAEDSDFVCEVCSYELVGVLPGGTSKQTISTNLAKELQNGVRTRAGHLYNEAAKELLAFLESVVYGRGGNKQDCAGSGHKYANRVDKLASLLGKEPACEDVKKLMSIAARAADVITKGAAGCLVPQDVALVTTAADDLANFGTKGAMHAAAKWFEDRGGPPTFTLDTLKALMDKAAHAAASFQKAKKAEDAKAVSELSAVKAAKAALEECQALRHSNSRCLRADSDSLALRLSLDSVSILSQFQFDVDSILTGALQGGGREELRRRDEGTRGDRWKGGCGARFLAGSAPHSEPPARSGAREKRPGSEPPTSPCHRPPLSAGCGGQTDQGDLRREACRLVHRSRGREAEAHRRRVGPGRWGDRGVGRCCARVAVRVRMHRQHPLAALGEGLAHQGAEG